MAHHARRLIETMLRLHALVPWDDVPSDEPFAIQIPGRDVPVVASFAFDGPARGLLLCEGGLDGWSQSMCNESNEFGAEIAPLQFGPIELPTRLRSESPRATDATWSIGSYPVPPLIENSGLEFTALALVDGASGELLHSDLVASPCLNRAVESIRGYADGACPGVPAVIRVRAGNEIDERILAALRPLFEPHGVACRTEPRLPELDSVIEEAQRSTAEFRLRLERRNRD
jgi:hypothetical protein